MFIGTPRRATAEPAQSLGARMTRVDQTDAHQGLISDDQIGVSLPAIRSPIEQVARLTERFQTRQPFTRIIRCLPSAPGDGRIRCLCREIVMRNRNIDTILFDMDGVLYRGRQVVPGAPEVLAQLRSRGYRIGFCSNNSSKSRQDYVRKLAEMGISAEEREIVNSAFATVTYLQEQGRLPCRVYVIGGEGLSAELAAAGAEVVDRGGPEVDFVIVGFDRNFNYDKLCEGFRALQQGAEFIATNRDATLPLEDGLYPGGGTMVAALETAIGRSPFVIGKPEPYSLLKLVAQLKSDPARTMMVGDRLETDILAGNRAGMTTTLVLTGVSTREMAENAPPEMRPDNIIESVASLPELFATGVG